MGKEKQKLFRESNIVVPHLNCGQGELVMGDTENSVQSVQSDRDGKLWRTLKQNSRLVVSDLLLDTKPQIA